MMFVTKTIDVVMIVLVTMAIASKNSVIHFQKYQVTVLYYFSTHIVKIKGKYSSI